MKKLHYLFVLTNTVLLSVTSCGKTDITHNAPNYSKSTGEFITFGYASPTNGTYYIDGIPISTGENYQTAERYREYKEAGLNTMMLQWEDRYPLAGETDFDSSHCKHLMDLCVEADIERCIITDSRVRDLSIGDKQIIGPNCQFASQEELNEYVANCIRDYYDHPVFYGLLLRDEPFYQHLEAFGQVYQAVKAFDPNIFIEANLLPYTIGDQQKQRYTPDWESMTSEEAYQDYLLRFLNYSHADKILMDDYPFRNNGNYDIIKDNYFEGIQILANFCKEHNLALEAVGQAFGGAIGGRRRWSMPTLPTMEWQYNHFMSMGIKTYSFYTYWRKVSNSTASDGEWFNDGESFVTSDGHKTSVYYNAQTLLNEMQAFAPVIMNFEYRSSKTIAHEPVAYPIAYSEIKDMKFAKLKNSNVKLQEGCVCFMTELYDKTHKNYMYMMENIMDPRLFDPSEDDLNMKFSINFGSDYNAVEVYYRGVKKLVPLKDGVYSSSLDAGYAEFLIPYKA